MKNQATVEFMILFMVFLLGVVIAAAASFQRVNEVNAEQLRAEAQRTLAAVATSLDTALIEGDGFISKVILPDSLGGKNYTLSLQPNLVVIRAGGQDFLQSTIVQNVTGSFSQGENTIRNVQGVLVIS